MPSAALEELVSKDGRKPHYLVDSQGALTQVGTAVCAEAVALRDGAWLAGGNEEFNAYEKLGFKQGSPVREYFTPQELRTLARECAVGTVKLSFQQPMDPRMVALYLGWFEHFSVFLQQNNASAQSIEQVELLVAALEPLHLENLGISTPEDKSGWMQAFRTLGDKSECHYTSIPSIETMILFALVDARD